MDNETVNNSNLSLDIPSTLNIPQLDDFGCDINLNDYHSLNEGEVEANLLDADNNVIGEDLQLNLEFECKKEEIVDSNENIDFFLDDFYNNESDDVHLLQVEVNSQSENESDPETVGILQEIEENKNKSCAESREDEECTFNDNLSNIMSDHNYTSQEEAIAETTSIDDILSNGNSLRSNIINHILSQNLKNEIVNTKSSEKKPQLEEFVDNVMQNISSYNLIDENTISETNSSTEPNKCIEEETNDADIFVQNIWDAVTADEEEEEKENKKKAQTSKTACISNKSVSTMFSQTEDQHKVTLCLSEAQTEYEAEEEPPVSPSFPENMSEPLEHSFSDVFEFERPTKKSNNKLLDELLSFSQKLREDCLAFQTASTNIENKLKSYIQEQLKRLKIIASDELPHCVDKSQQTDSQKISARKKRSLNKKNKKDLLKESSGSSCSSGVDQYSDTDASDVTDISKTTVVLPIQASKEIKLTSKEQLDENHLPATMDSQVFNVINEYDDGIPMSKYIQSEIFGSGTVSDRESLSPDRERVTRLSDKLLKHVSDNENSNDENGIVGIKKICESFKKKKHSRSESDKENKLSSSEKLSSPLKKNKNDLQSSDEDGKVDKEIERLININALEKRSIYAGSKSTKESEKQKTKVPQQKYKNNILDFSDDDLGKSGESDESISEAEEEIITEEQYLARRNENLKQELLNPSSSDSDITDEEVDQLGESNSDDDGSKSPLVDKFLKNFVVEESDHNDNDETDNSDVEIDKSDEQAQQIDQETGSVEQEKDKMKMNMNITSPITSDSELLNDSQRSSKQNRQKTLEKMLSEVEKRKKINKIDEDLISLSSESAGSDVESVENETVDEKSRVIKPMLRPDQLASETRKAQKDEAERIRRLEKKLTRMADVLKEHGDAIKDDFVLDYIGETKTFVKVHPGIVKHLKKHQFDGVKFMYDSCYGGVVALKKHAGSGCILAHCMGLGKTLQLIALLHTVISYKELKTSKVLVLCPKSTVMNWADEVRRWLAPLNTRNLRVFTFNDTSDIHEKLNVIKKWSQSTFGNAGALLIGYEAFRTLVFYHSYKNRGNISPARLEEIREKIDSYLLKPGADLVVCDEGHIIKNSKSAISMAVSKIVTLRRIVLTGTPIQNNLKEYYSMVNFIKPLFLGTEKEFANLYANPIKNGQHKDSSKLDIKIMKQRSFVLHKKLSKFVQRKEAELLKTFLPQKYEYVLFMPMTDVQNKLYEHILEAISKRQENRGRTLITDYTCLRKIWTHPKVLEDAWKNATDQKNKRDAQKNKTPHSDDDQPDDIYDSQTGVMSVTNDWWRSLLNNNELESILPSNKLRATLEILRMCEEKGEKCLIFSAFVAVLNVVEYFFKKLTNSEPGVLNDLGIPTSQRTTNQWILGKDYYRLDGKTPKSLRHEMIKQFNMSDNKRARVFLISSKAGGQGINLIGANRVIILDTSWNPSNDQQNIFRIFRLGQKKKCFIYRLLAMGTMEEKVYSRSVTKQAMSYRVVDEQQIDRHYSMAELAELYTLTKPDFSQRPVPVLPQDSILASLMLNYPQMVYRYHEHDSLLENKVEQELSEQEKADAWIAYERDLQMSSQVQEMPNMENAMHGNFAIPKIPNYMGQMPGLDMQTLLNYSMNNMNKSTSPYIKSLLAQYNYPPNQQQQQYLDMLNLYQKYVMNYPGETFNSAAGIYPQMGVPNPMSANSSSLLASLHGNAGLSTNPLTALGDLSMYGIGAQKGLMGNLSNASPFTPPLPSLNSPLSNFGSTSSVSANLHNSNNNANSLLSSFGQYKPPALDTTYANHFNFPRNDFPSTSTSKQNTMSMQSNFLSLDQYNKNATPGMQNPSNSTIPSTTKSSHDQRSLMNLSTKSKDSPQHMSGNHSPQVASSDSVTKNPSRKSQETSSSSKPQKQKPTSNNVATNPSPPQLLNTKSSSKDKNPSNPNQNQQQQTRPNTTTSSAPPLTHFNSSGNVLKKPPTPTNGPKTRIGGVNMGISYPSRASPIPNMTQTTVTSKTTSNISTEKSTSNATTPATQKLLKNNSEMQIILTTSGTTSIAKQLNDISPSISLTAVRQTNPTRTTASTSTPLSSFKTTDQSATISPVHTVSKQHQQQQQQQQQQSNAKSNYTPNSSNNGKSQLTTQRSITPVSGHIKKTKVVQNKSQSSMPSSLTPRIPTSIPSISAKTAAAAAVLARTTPKSQNSPHGLMQKSQQPPIPVAISKNAIKTPSATNSSAQMQNKQIRDASPIITSVTSQASAKPNNTINANRQNVQITKDPLKIRTSTGSVVGLSSAAMEKRNLVNPHSLSPAASTSTSTSTASAATSSNLAYQRNAINIRPANDGKNKSASKGAYVIETNINDRRVAIGTPTKSGGGTTVTKIAKKRPAPDSTPGQQQPRDVADLKRLKQSNV